MDDPLFGDHIRKRKFDVIKVKATKSNESENFELDDQEVWKSRILRSYTEWAFSHGCSSTDSSHMTQSPEHWRHVIIPCHEWKILAAITVKNEKKNSYKERWIIICFLINLIIWFRTPLRIPQKQDKRMGTHKGPTLRLHKHVPFHYIKSNLSGFFLFHTPHMEYNLFPYN